MTSDPSLIAVPPSIGAPFRDKVRIRFRKGSHLRLLSHHDLMRTFERMLRRADLPFLRSQGFNPRPRLIFALSMPLGVVGEAEVVELELGQKLSVDEIRERLTRQAPPGLQIVSVLHIDVKITAQVHSLCYAVEIPPERIDALRSCLAEVLGSAECWWDRSRPPIRRVDLRQWISDLQIQGPSFPSRSCTLEMYLRLTPNGTARPEEVLGLLGLADLIDAGAVFRRTRLELQDETPSPHAEGIR